MADESIPMTKDGFEELTALLKKYKEIDRPRVIQAIAEARGHGDLKENAEYAAAREEQGILEARIKELDASLSRAKVVDFSGQNVDQIRIGAYVDIVNEDSGEERTVRIVSDLEADIERGKISISSPLAKALLGRKEGDVVEFSAPKGLTEYAISNIKY